MPVAQLELTYRRLARAALGTAVVFAVSGALLGTWVSRLPATRDRLHASPAELGLALLAPGVGSLVSMPSTGWLCRRFGSRATVAAFALPCCVAVFGMSVVPSLATLAVALFVWGMLFGAWDVSMNVQGSAVEQRAGRAWMPRYHASWSAGGIAGAAAGGLAARAAVPVPLHFALAAGVGVVLVAGALRFYIPDRETGPPAESGKRGAWSTVLTRRVVAIGLITLCGVTVEGAAADWLALYLVDERRSGEALGAVGYAVFAFAMAAGRFVGTPIMERLGRHGAVRAGGLVIAAGVAVTVFGPGLPLAYLGTVLWALGVCLIFPAAMSAAGESPGRPTDAIAAVSAVGYAGILTGPPVIGILADHVGIGRALLVLFVLAAAICAFAPAVRVRQ
ncbi:MFS transporter [Planosporangium mesophilum]|uniref:MFS transporter n=1 Tax=Planosporangium mesophilum TaxID=689768 RepID=A0A8J3TBM3_9ACTN|nr:MFS transporter [Planosporangium mesophilum]NJC85853.1 MFS transporter [Planosporangium mesophilum]GII21914.1 MFS transporter [Planosporangium mesophilum]